MKHPASAKSAEGRGTRRTALYDAILMALKHLDPPQPGDAIVVVTDGGENASKAQRSQVVKALRAQSGVRLFAWLLPDWPPDLEAEGRERLIEMVNDSGGGTLDISAPYFPANYSYGRQPSLPLDERMKSLIENSANSLTSQIDDFYFLTLKFPANAREPRKWNVELVDERGQRRKEIALAYPGHTNATFASPGHGMPEMPDAPQRGPN